AIWPRCCACSTAGSSRWWSRAVSPLVLDLSLPSASTPLSAVILGLDPRIGLSSREAWTVEDAAWLDPRVKPEDDGGNGANSKEKGPDVAVGASFFLGLSPFALKSAVTASQP